MSETFWFIWNIHFDETRKWKDEKVFIFILMNNVKNTNILELKSKGFSGSQV